MKRSRNHKKPHPASNLILEEVIGLTTKNGNGLASTTSCSKCAYIAGCVVVLYDVDSGTQSHFRGPNRTPRPLSCVALSRDATVVVAGESGHQPAILVWDCITLSFICELKGHQYGVRCVSLPPDGKHLVSVGFPRDGCICVWDWRNNILVTKVKASSASSPVASIDFSSQEKFFVTAGKNHFKFWKIRRSPGSRSSTRSLVSVTTERVVNLDHSKEWSFVAVTSVSWMRSSSVNDIKGSELVTFYAVTEEGTLCMVCPGSSVINSVELEVEKCFAVSASDSLVACACDNGIVELFGTKSLEYAGRLCYGETKRLKESNIADNKTDFSQVVQTWHGLPNAIACQFSTLKKLVVVYDDHSLHIWNVEDIHKATRCCVLVTHNECIWDIKNVPCENMHDPSLSCVARGCSGGLCFATCSVDGTIRLWDLALQSTLSVDNSSLVVDKSSNGSICLVSAGIFERESIAIDTSSHGFRSMAVSSDGKHLAAGDSCGNIHIFDLHTSEYICIQDAHGAEILSLSFNFTNKNDTTSTEIVESYRLLASGGRDGVIHLFDVDRNFNLVGSINYHSSAVIGVKVGRSGREILSCADRFLVLHSVDLKGTECKTSILKKIVATRSINDMVVDHCVKIAIIISQDKNIDVFDIQSGNLIKSLKHDGDVGHPVKVITDGSCSYLACSYSNKCICVYDYVTGEMVARATGHSVVITGITFLPDCRHLVSVGIDGCIFVWKLPAYLSSRMLQRVKEVPFRFLSESVNEPLTLKLLKPCEAVDLPQEGYGEKVSVKNIWNQNRDKMSDSECSCPETSGFRFSISRLPNWAQCKVDTSSPLVDADSSWSKVDSSNNACHESRNLSNKISGKLSQRLSETESSRGSESPSENYSWTKHRWLTIHTVCTDITGSPETCELKSLNVQGSLMNRRSDSQIMETSHSSKRMKFSSLDPMTNNPSSECDFNINKHVKSHDDPFDVDAFRKDSQEDDIFRSNFGNWSEKVTTDKEKSLTMSSSRFLVRKERLEGRKMSFGLHVLDSAGALMTRTKEADSTFLQQKPSMSILEATRNAPPSSWRQMSDISKFAPDVSDRTGDAEIPLNMKAINVEAFDVAEVEEVEFARSCEEALYNLEAAAENALHLFSKLAKLDTGEEKTRRSAEVQLYAKAAEKFPLIERKIHAVAKLLKSDL